MKRSELYALVWARPMIHVAAELGLSGPGLAKLCARHGIPTPPRGQWAKLQAGKRSPQSPLPRPDLDPTLYLPSAAERERKARQREFAEGVRATLDARVDAETDRSLADRLDEGEEGAARGTGRADSDSTASPPRIAVAVAASLDRPHRLVRATATVVQRLPALQARWARATPAQRASPRLASLPPVRQGRFELDVTGGLALIASLEAMDWILRFADALLKGLQAQRVHIERSVREGEQWATLRLTKDGEMLTLSPIVEGYKRQPVDDDELARLQQTDRWASKWRYEPTGRFSLNMQGTERIVHARWSGSPEHLEAQLGRMVATCLELMARQPAHRKERELEEERRRQEAERQDKLRRQHQARQEQLKRAFEASQQYEQEQILRRFLAMVERDVDKFVEPYPQRTKVWLQVVREQLDQAIPWHETLGQCLSVPSWQTWPPPWWPQEPEVSAD